MSEVRKCTGCGGNLEFLGERQIQLGQVGFMLGHLSNLMAGALDVELWECPDCGKIEFYRQGSSDVEEEEDHMALTICPNCGAEHELDDPTCPGCGAKNPYI